MIKNIIKLFVVGVGLYLFKEVTDKWVENKESKEE
jgi:hypothetical protein